jgi:hypothetical protein
MERLNNHSSTRQLREIMEQQRNAAIWTAVIHWSPTEITVSVLGLLNTGQSLLILFVVYLATPFP